METVAVIFGGRSTEHDVSIITALASIIKPLELTGKYRVVPVYITRDGRWYSGDELKDIRLYQSDALDRYLARSTPVAISFDKGLQLLTAARFGHQRTTVDVVFPAMHGTYGEDGALMGLLDMAGVPYVGCGVAASAVAMDKVLAKQVAAANDIPVCSFLHCTRDEVKTDIAGVVTRVTSSLHYPIFVKPAHLGSSIGISRVANDTELQNALEVAAYYDDRVIIEEAVQHLIEVTLPVMGPADAPQPALLERPLTSAEQFFDFDTKYLQGGKGKKGGGEKSGGKKGTQGYSQVPAVLPEGLYEKAEAIGLRAYKALGCSGIARIDMLINSQSGDVYFNEANPLPGSLYAHNWAKAGVSKVALVEWLITLANERHESRTALATTFSTTYLKQF